MAAKSAAILTFNADGTTTSRQHPTLAAPGPKKRKGSKRYKGIEKMIRKLGKAAATTSQTYLDRHERSNSKKKNGWLKDLRKNVGKARRRGMKVMKVRLY